MLIHLCFRKIHLIFIWMLCGSYLNGQSISQEVIYQGIKVTCEIEHLDEQKKAGVFKEDDHVNFKFSVSDTLSNEGLSGVYPAAWLGRKDVVTPASCLEKVKSYLTGGILNKADFDLNVYYVLAMNEDASINVVDPLFGYGGTKLLAKIMLNSPGMDWAITADESFVFVSLPGAKEVAVVQTKNWEVLKNIAIPGVPVHTKLQADGAWLWVTYVVEDRLDAQKTGVIAINTADFTIKKVLPTGSGWHEIALDDENRFVFVSNSMDGTITIIDIQSLEIITTVYTSENPTALTWSPISKTLLVGHKGDGQIFVIDGQRHDINTIIKAEAGIEQIAVAPNRGLAFVVNPDEDLVHIIDLTNNQIVQTADVENQPDAISFTDGLAYIRHRGSETILMIPLEAVETPNTPVNVIDFPGGQNPAGQTNYPTAAAGIVQAPGESAVLIANALDKMIYYYMEGMAAPMGSFSNYGREPRAVMVVDRSLQEIEKGVYQTTVQLRNPGNYDIAFFMNAPRLTHCFQIEVGFDENKAKQRILEQFGNLEIDYLTDDKIISKKREKMFRFRLKDRLSQQFLINLEDVFVLQMDASGMNFQKRWAIMNKEKEIYEVPIENLDNGIYHFYIECPSKDFSVEKNPAVSFEIVD